VTVFAITVEGVLQPDGVTVRVEERLALPPGRVTLTLQAPVVPAGTPAEEAYAEAAVPQLEWRWDKGRRKIRAAVKEYSRQTHADY
jgi:hypothetical protein